MDTIDPDERVELVQELQAIVADEVPIVTLYYEDIVNAYDADVYDDWAFQAGKGLFTKLSFVDLDVDVDAAEAEEEAEPEEDVAEEPEEEPVEEDVAAEPAADEDAGLGAGLQALLIILALLVIGIVAALVITRRRDAGAGETG